MNANRNSEGIQILVSCRIFAALVIGFHCLTASAVEDCESISIAADMSFLNGELRRAEDLYFSVLASDESSALCQSNAYIQLRKLCDHYGPDWQRCVERVIVNTRDAGVLDYQYSDKINRLAIEYEKKGAMERAQELWQEMLALANAAPHQWSISYRSIALTHLGDIAYQEAEWKKAIEHYSDVLLLQEDIDGDASYMGLIPALLRLGRAYSAGGYYDKALPVLERAMGLLDDLESGSEYAETVEALEAYSVALAGLSRFDEANDARARADAIRTGWSTH